MRLAISGNNVRSFPNETAPDRFIDSIKSNPSIHPINQSNRIDEAVNHWTQKSINQSIEGATAAFTNLEKTKYYSPSNRDLLQQFIEKRPIRRLAVRRTQGKRQEIQHGADNQRPTAPFHMHGKHLQQSLHELFRGH